MRRTLLLLLLVPSALAQFPSDRVYPWSAGTNVGIVGGIVRRDTIFTNMTTLDSSGVTNVAEDIQAAISACPSNQVVLLPAGTFRLDTAINVDHAQDGVTLRGAGIGQTVLMCYQSSGYGAIELGTSDYPGPPPTINILSGASAGSTNVVCDSTVGVIVGGIVRIGQITPDYVFNTGPGTNLQFSVHLILSTNASDISFRPPLPLTLTNSPHVAKYTQLLSGMSVEDVTVNLSGASVAAIFGYQVSESWFDNIEITGSTTRQMWFYYLVGSEIRNCYTHATRTSGPGHEGIDLSVGSCWNLVENNVSISGGYPAIIIGDGSGGCVGNVIAYNWADHIDSGSTVSGAAFSVNHGPHNMFNLFEGNVGEMFQSDGYFGSASHNTLFRNNFTGTFSSSNVWQRAVDLCRWSYYFNAAANVIGSTNQAFAYSTTNSGYSDPLIYRFGFPNMGNMSYSGANPPTTNWAGLDAKVAETVLLVANYDYATDGIVNPTNDLPASLYRSSAPSFMSGYIWPSIGSDLTPMVSRIPAQDRFTSRIATADLVNVGTLIIAP